MTIDWITCVHEAAHAVVYATAGRGVKQLVLRDAPGAAAVVPADALGVCDLEPLGFAAPCGWHEKEQTHWFKPLQWAAMREASTDPEGMTQSLRAEICGLLAGPLSEVRLSGEEWGPLRSIKGKLDDFCLAGGYAALLGDDADTVGTHYAWATMDLLSEPQTWGRVLGIALALQHRRALAGADLAAYLPKPREGWPGCWAV